MTKFCAFVDVGVDQDGLIHVTELSTRYIKEPGDAVKVGQVAKVKVLSADSVSKRIALSIEALEAPRERAEPKPSKPKLDTQIASLADKLRSQ